MKFGIVGPISKDHITLFTGEKLAKYGAAAYSACAMAKLLEGTADHLICLSHLSAADMGQVSRLLTHPNIDLTGLVATEKGTAEIDLTYVNQYERRSRQIQTMKPIALTEISLLSDCTAVLLMPLNETDIPLECVQELRRSTDGLIFLDAHGLVTGVNEKGERYKKVWANAGEWFKHLDILKMNEHEATWVAGHPLTTGQSFVEFATDIVGQGLKACWVTFGDQSSLIVWQQEKRTFWANVPVVSGIGPVIDTTGCGDASSAGFVYCYVKFFYRALMAVIMGNTLGSLKATFAETDAFPSHLDIQGVIGHHYRDYLHALLDDFLIKSQVIVHEIKGGHDVESFMYGPDGTGHRPWTNHADSSGS